MLKRSAMTVNDSHATEIEDCSIHSVLSFHSSMSVLDTTACQSECQTDDGVQSDHSPGDHSTSFYPESETSVEQDDDPTETDDDSETTPSLSHQRINLDATQKRNAIAIQRFTKRYIKTKRLLQANHFVNVVIGNAIDRITEQSWERKRNSAATKLQASIRGFLGRVFVSEHYFVDCAMSGMLFLYSCYLTVNIFISVHFIQSNPDQVSLYIFVHGDNGHVPQRI